MNENSLCFTNSYKKHSNKICYDKTQFPKLSYTIEEMDKKTMDQFNFSENVKKIINKFNSMYSFDVFGYRTPKTEVSKRKAYYIKWSSDKYIVYWDLGASMIVSNDDVFAICHDKYSDFQSGDVSCLLYILENGDRLIVNCGDVESCILFTMHDPIKL